MELLRQMDRVSADLRRQANDILAATQTVAELQGERAALINRAACQMLRTARELELAQRLTDQDELRLDLQPMDLTVWGRETAEQAEGPLAQREVALEFRTSLPFLFTLGDQSLLSYLLYALLAHFLRPRPGPGRLVLTLEARERSALLSLEEAGRPAGALAPLTEEGALSGETGLDLPLAQLIAALHGGVLMTAQGEGGWAAHLSLPLREESSSAALCSPGMGQDLLGGFSPALVALSEVLPARAFLPAALE